MPKTGRRRSFAALARLARKKRRDRKRFLKGWRKELHEIEVLFNCTVTDSNDSEDSLLSSERSSERALSEIDSEDREMLFGDEDNDSSSPADLMIIEEESVWEDDVVWVSNTRHDELEQPNHHEAPQPLVANQALDLEIFEIYPRDDCPVCLAKLFPRAHGDAEEIEDADADPAAYDVYQCSNCIHMLHKLCLERTFQEGNPILPLEMLPPLKKQCPVCRRPLKSNKTKKIWMRMCEGEGDDVVLVYERIRTYPPGAVIPCHPEDLVEPLELLEN